MERVSRRAFQSAAVAELFAQYPPKMRKRLYALRELIFDTAQQVDGVGNLEETLKWGQPAYLTTESKSGSLIRIDALASEPGSYALYVHCQTKLVGMFRSLYPEFTYRGTRAIIFHESDPLPTDELRECISLALTYYLKKKTFKE